MVGELELGKVGVELRGLLSEAETLRTEVYGRYVAAVVKDTTYYNMTKQTRLIPDDWKNRGVPEVIPPTAYDAIENAADHILTRPQLSIPARAVIDDERAEQRIAELKRAAARIFWDQIDKQGSPLAQGKKKLVKDGKAVWKKLIRWGDIPKPKDGGPARPVGEKRLVWEVRSLAPETVFEDPDDPYDPSFVYEVYSARVGKTSSRFPDAIGQWRFDGRSKTVQVTEYWSKPEGSDKGLHVIWVDDEPVQRTINPYHYTTPRHTEEEPDYDGYVPYTIRPSGWGEVTADLDPAEFYVGLIRRAHSVIDAEAMQITGANAQMLIGTYPLVVLMNVPESKKIEVGPGRVIRLETDQDIRIVPWPSIPAATFQVIDRMQQYVNDLTKFRTLGGTPLKGVDTATEAEQTFRAASSKLSGPVAAITSAVESMSEQMFLDIDRIIELPVVLFGDSDGDQVLIGPADIDGFYAVRAVLTTTDKESLIRSDARLWSDAYVKVPGLSVETVMERMGIEDPSRERRNRAREDLSNSPIVQRSRELAFVAAMQESIGPLREAFLNELRAGGNTGDTRPPVPGDDVGNTVEPGIRSQMSLEAQERRPETLAE